MARSQSSSEMSTRTKESDLHPRSFGLNPPTLTDFQEDLFVFGLYSLNVICAVAGINMTLHLYQHKVHRILIQVHEPEVGPNNLDEEELTIGQDRVKDLSLGLESSPGRTCPLLVSQHHEIREDE
jgi:hypothetical protein